MLREWIDIILLFFAKSRDVLKKDINGKTIKHIWVSYVLFVVIALLLVWGIPRGFSDGFLNYATSILSIFVGFFITVLVFVDDKLKPTKLPTKEEENTKPANERLNQEQIINILQESNYTVRFFYALGLNILFSTIVLFMLLPNILWFDAFSLNISEYTIIDDISQLSLNSILMGLYFWCIIIYRVVILYLMLKVFFYTTYATSSLVSVIILKRKI